MRRRFGAKCTPHCVHGMCRGRGRNVWDLQRVLAWAGAVGRQRLLRAVWGGDGGSIGHVQSLCAWQESI